MLQNIFLYLVFMLLAVLKNCFLLIDIIVPLPLPQEVRTFFIKPCHITVLSSALAFLQGCSVEGDAHPASASSPPPADCIGSHGQGEASQSPPQKWLQPIAREESFSGSAKTPTRGQPGGEEQYC